MSGKLEDAIGAAVKAGRFVHLSVNSSQIGKRANFIATYSDARYQGNHTVEDRDPVDAMIKAMKTRPGKAKAEEDFG